MAEISYYDADLSDALKVLNEMMDRYNKAPAGVKPELLTQAEKKLKETLELKKGYQLALRQAPRDDGKRFREKFEEYSAKVEQLSGEVRWARSEQERSGLFGDPKARAAAGGPPSGNQEMLDKAVNIQMKTEQSLMSTQKMVQASKEVANATSAQLQQQRNQIVQITEEVMRIEDGLQRADKLIRNFARRMATDRVILLFTFLVFAGIAGIVVYKSMHPNDQTFYVPDEVVPPNPVEIYNKTRDAINSTLNSNS